MKKGRYVFRIKKLAQLKGLACVGVLISAPSWAHETVQHSAAQSADIAITGSAEMRIVGNKRVFMSDGLPSHQTGQFPNRGNPNQIKAQSIQVEMPLNPVKNTVAQDIRALGIALNGVLFEPGTAECFGQTRGGGTDHSAKHPKRGQKPQAGQNRQANQGQRRRGRPSDCAWREEALVNGKGRLGLDDNNAHVQPTGLYHYHGIPEGLVAQLPRDDKGDVHIGYAADGFPIYVDLTGAKTPSYQLKSGNRPSGENQPGGAYDGTYTADFEFKSASGTLDACNGQMVAGQYRYYATSHFPYLPRCLWGEVDKSFDKKPR